MIFARYLLKEFLRLYLGICSTFLFVYCMIDFLEKNTRYFPKYGATWLVIFEYYLVQTPKMFVDISPFSVMFSAIITTWIFARSGEISALRAAGQSIRKICSPILIFSFAIGMTCFLISEFIVPEAMLRLQKVETVKIEKSELSQMFLESQWVRGEGSILHFKKLNQLERTLIDPEYIVLHNRNEVEQIVFARKAVFDQKRDVWSLVDARVSTFSEAGELLSTEKVSAFPTNVASQPPKLLREGVSSDLVSYRELRRVLSESRSSGGAMASREADLYQKLSSPFANLLFAFFALPFALRRERQADTYIGIVVCLLTAAMYSGGSASLRTMAVSGSVSPYLAAWCPPLLFLCFGVILMLRVDRRS
ncbi:MAG: YjgP/YjgQ family permease [Betaproteobacteria bacterium]|nr:YjgP/YjgQ family permease [Betaproteobacteria bacterium]